MIYPFADKLENLGTKYGLVVLAAKRAKQLKSGVQPAIDTDSRNPLTIALEEIAMGKIKCEVPDHDIEATTSVEPEVAQLLAIPERLDEEEETEAAAPVTEDETLLEIEDEDLEEWEEEDTEEDEVIPLDKHLENGIPLVVDEENEDDVEDPLDVPEPKPKRGRRKAQPEPDADESLLGVDPDVDVDVDLDADDLAIDEE